MFFLHPNKWKIQKTDDKGQGVFAQKLIKAGTVIGDYLGMVVKTADYDLENDKDGLYLMYYSDQKSIYPDLKKPGIHLLNHSCEPNCWIYMYRGHTLYFALRDIKPTEELTISYLLSPLDKTCKPCTHQCVCKSRHCTGTMHMSPGAFVRWQLFQDNQQKNVRRAPAIVGTFLSKLSSYPKFIPTLPFYTTLIPH